MTQSERQDPADATVEPLERPEPNCEYVGPEARLRGAGFAWRDPGGTWCFETAREYEGCVVLGVERKDIRLYGEMEMAA